MTLNDLVTELNVISAKFPNRLICVNYTHVDITAKSILKQYNFSIEKIYNPSASDLYIEITPSAPYTTVECLLNILKRKQKILSGNLDIKTEYLNVIKPVTKVDDRTFYAMICS